MKLKLLIVVLLILSSCATHQPFKPEVSRSIGYTELYWIVKYSYPGLDNYSMTDKVYRIPTDPGQLLSNFPDKDLPYIENKRDCDDFVYMFKAWLSKEGQGDLLVMSIKIEIQGRRPHMVVGFLLDGKIVFGDPKLGRLVRYRDAVIKRITI